MRRRQLGEQNRKSGFFWSTCQITCIHGERERERQGIERKERKNSILVPVFSVHFMMFWQENQPLYTTHLRYTTREAQRGVRTLWPVFPFLSHVENPHTYNIILSLCELSHTVQNFPHFFFYLKHHHHLLVYILTSLAHSLYKTRTLSQWIFLYNWQLKLPLQVGVVVMGVCGRSGK